MSTFKGWDDEDTITRYVSLLETLDSSSDRSYVSSTSLSGRRPSPKKAASSYNTFGGDSDDLQSPFEYDKKDESTPKKMYEYQPFAVNRTEWLSFDSMGRGNTASSRFSDDEHDVFLEDYNTRYSPLSRLYYLF
jgi:hypothetical protein